MIIQRLTYFEYTDEVDFAKGSKCKSSVVSIHLMLNA